MGKSEALTEVWRGEYLECIHRGHVAVCNANGDLLASWGDPNANILPRSSCKMLQTLPLIESGAADAYGLTSEHLALACASHQGAEIHTSRVSTWLENLQLSETDLRCGGHRPKDHDAADDLVRNGKNFNQTHNNCSGKHSGFLTLNKHIGGDAEYIEIDHPIQQQIKNAIEDMADQQTSGYAIDGCSAPNFGVTLFGLACSMARMAKPTGLGRIREQAIVRLVDAMAKHPELVAGETRACTDLMRAMDGRTVVKTGAEGVFAAILPDHGIGVAIKIEDGATRAAECSIAALLVRLGVANPDHPLVNNLLFHEQRNSRNMLVGSIKPSANLYANGQKL